MTPEELRNLYDRSWQAKGKNRDGIGLGLSIVKGIVEAHGGRIWAESALGEGTRYFSSRSRPASGSPPQLPRPRPSPPSLSSTCDANVSVVIPGSSAFIIGCRKNLRDSPVT